MKLGVHIGYWGLGLTSADQLEIVREAERLGYDSVWTAEAYGSDAATILGWLAGQTERIRIGSAIFPMPARSPAVSAIHPATLVQLAGDARHDRRDARPAQRRADAPRDRLVRPAGRRGLARPALRPPAPAHARVRRGRAQGARPRAARVPRRDARAAAPRGSRQGAEADDRARPGPDPDLPRGDRAEEHAARRRDRRRLDPDLLLARERRRPAPAARGGRRPLRPLARRLRHRPDG